MAAQWELKVAGARPKTPTSAESPKSNLPGVRDFTPSLPAYNSKHQIFSGSCEKV